MNPLKFSSIWSFLPTAYLFIFLPQSVIGIFYLSGNASIVVLKVFCVGIIAYLVGYAITRILLNKKSSINYCLFYLNDKKIFFITVFFFAVYLLLLLYVTMTVENIPLWVALGGGTSLEITESREMLFRTRIGWEKVLIYFFSILTSVFIPYFLMLCFLNRSRLAWPLYSLFYLSLLVPMEKALFIKAFLPFFLIAANGYLSRRALYAAALIAVIVLLSMNFLARGVDSGASQGTPSVKITELNSNHKKSSISLIQNGTDLTFEQHVEKYYPLRGTSAISSVINRALWIPYVTAYDWIQYFEQEMGGVNLGGLTSSFVSKLLGGDRVPMEQYIFDYQFGLGSIKTAGANANFMVDGFVNFGMVGVIFLSALVGIFTFIIMKLNNPAGCACYYLFLFQLLGGGFLGTFFGGGLLLFLLLIYLFPPNFSAKDSSLPLQ